MTPYGALLFILLLNSTLAVRSVPRSYSETHNCALSPDLVEEIKSYDTVVQDIFDYVLSGPFKGKTYDELAKFVDSMGPRLSGSQELENAIDYMINLTRSKEIDDIVTETVSVPHWVRGEESVLMVQPRYKPMSVIGLGYSVSTPPGGIVAEAVVVKDFKELEAMSTDEIKGKIVVYNEDYITYGETVQYRSQAATKAAQKGAVASLIRSITPFSMNTVHTGMQRYGPNVTKIPTAAITPEDAHLIARLNEGLFKVVLYIKMNSTIDNKTSRNTLIDLKGRNEPEKLVIVSGHIDSWDVGQGAMDDGGGMFISWAVPVILKELNLVPRRTIRSIFWTAEELGLVGARAYADRHKDELDKINFIMESDEGTFSPTGLSVAGNQKTRCIVAEVLKLFSAINATVLTEEDYPGSDIVEIISKGVPGAGLSNANERYFWFHHTEADTMDVENTKELDLCAAFWTAVAYVIADLSVDLPRG